MANSSATHYTRGLATMHWIMAVLIIALLVAIEAREFFPKENPLRGQLKTLHYSLGLAVLGLIAARVGLRIASPTPAILPKPAAWQTGLSHLMHLAFYVVMIGMPILGWITLSALGKDIALFGLQLPALIAQDKEFGHLLEEWHKILGEVTIYLIGLHAAAAVFHHAIVKDNTLLRMLPAR